MSDSNQSKAYLGTGWGFPPTFSKQTADVGMLSGVEDIESSLRILLGTRPGERVMQPEFGCNLDRLLFEPLTTTMKTYMTELIKTAVLFYEPRIILNSVDLTGSDDNEGLVLITLNYTVRTTNTRFNYVYPYYMNEGSDVTK